MNGLTKDEETVLHALGELQPTTETEVAAFTGLAVKEVKRILTELAKKGFSDSVGENDADLTV
jgi:hypothetical protein